ncbi:MAG: serine/threonine protein kinase [Proteobacteria bacterium]|nr:serine/threonine protein kinase [Pseudomonadota bacterium]
MTTSDRLIGKVLGGLYRIDRLLATGSTAVVYRGTHVRLGQPLAIKVLAGPLLANSAQLARFTAEAAVQAKLHHPHIATVYDFVREGDLHAIAMEYVEGPGLDQVMFELGGPMPIERIKALMLPVLDAVEYAHQHDIVHRDLKPSNILIAQMGSRELPKVVDFGIAKVVAEGDTMTAPGAMLGTLLFMSPEQCKALRTVDRRADVYSLGVTLYQLATGMVPFYAESAFDIMLAHVQLPPTPPQELEPGLPDALCELILRALAKDPEDRFSRVSELAHALAAVPVPRTTAERAAVAHAGPDRPVAALPGWSRDQPPHGPTGTLPAFGDLDRGGLRRRPGRLHAAARAGASALGAGDTRGLAERRIRPGGVPEQRVPAGCRVLAGCQRPELTGPRRATCAAQQQRRATCQLGAAARARQRLKRAALRARPRAPAPHGRGGAPTPARSDPRGLVALLRCESRRRRHLLPGRRAAPGGRGRATGGDLHRRPTLLPRRCSDVAPHRAQRRARARRRRHPAAPQSARQGQLPQPLGQRRRLGSAPAAPFAAAPARDLQRPHRSARQLHARHQRRGRLHPLA